MATGWTLERRERQAELIHRWKPWKQSTGPKTAEGRAKAAQRGHKGAVRPKLRELGQALREHQRALAQIPGLTGRPTPD